MCGIPGAGKSFFAKHFLKDAAYISRDEIRYRLIGEDATEKEYFSKEIETFNFFVSLIQDNIDLGENVCADATHINWNSRKKLLNALRLDENVDIVAVVINAPLEDCLKRNSQRNGLRKVPEGVIKRMYKNMTDPANDPFRYTGIEYVSNKEG